MRKIGIGKNAVAMGFFDGVHLGHRYVLEKVYALAYKDYSPVIFTFEPEAVKIKESGISGYIYTAEEKQHIFESCGFNSVYSPAFSELCNLSGEEFAEHILAGRMNAAAVCCGEDFRFGKGAACGVDELRKFGEKYGFEVCTAKKVRLGGVAVSSGEIRRCLVNGDIEQANLFLDRPYTIDKKVVHGASLGHTIGFPTANQLYEKGQLVPKFGVYASETEVNGKFYLSITNIGVKPTVDYGGQPVAETYITGFSRDIYDTRIQVRLKRFIRPEQKFVSVEELKSQIRRDVESAIENSYC